MRWTQRKMGMNCPSNNRRKMWKEPIMLRGMMRGRSPPRYALCAEPENKIWKRRKPDGSALAGGCRRFFHPVLRDKPDIRLKKEWLFSIRRSRCFNPSSSPSARFCPSGAALTCWKVTAGTTPARMLMYGKEASNRKQEIDRQHYTIPNQRPKDKHCGKI